jgi:hypothetical protein
MARKYLRIKADGYVMNYNPELEAHTPSDAFESDEPPPEFIPDLPLYLASKIVDADAVAKVKRGKKDEVKYLVDAEGNKVA